MSAERSAASVSKLTHSMREAQASRTTVTLTFNGKQLNGYLVDLVENGSGRTSVVESVSFLPTTFDPLIESLQEVEVIVGCYTSAGFIEISATASYSVSVVPIIRLQNIAFTTSKQDRRSGRTTVVERPKSFVCIETSDLSFIGSFELRDVSHSAVGGILYLPNKLPDESCVLSGRVTTGNAALRLTNAKLVRFEVLPTQNSTNFEYKVAIDISVKSTPPSHIDRRQFSRKLIEKFSLIDVASSLFPDVRVQVRITDLSTGGLSGHLVEPPDENLFPIGCEVLLGHLRGIIVFNESGVIRIRWLFDSNDSHKVWEEMLARFADRSNELRSYESHSVLTLMARSGIKSGDFVASFKTAKGMYAPFGEIEKSGNLIVYRAVQRGDAGNLLAHIGSFKIADNLWFNGDLFASHQEKGHSTKDFVSEYFKSFIEFAQTCRPYPKIISAWIKGHPYWSRLENALLRDDCTVLYSQASIRTFLPDIRIPIPKLPSDVRVESVEASDHKEIAKLLDLAAESGTAAFLKAFDFDSDRFGSPLLKLSLEQSNYEFYRRYLKIVLGDQTFLAVISRMPEGISPQRHQNAVWIFQIQGGVRGEYAEYVVGVAIKAAVAGGTFPSVVRFVGKDLSSLPGKEGLVVLADPKMWSLQNE